MALIEKPQLPPLKVGSSDYRGTRYHYVQTYTFHYDPATKKCKTEIVSVELPELKNISVESIINEAKDKGIDVVKHLRQYISVQEVSI